MLGYNGSIPGPTLHVDQGSEITVQVTQRRRRRGDGSLARPAAGEPLRRRPARDAGTDPDRGHVHLQGPVPRRRVLLVPPAHPRGLRAGDGPVRHDHRRALRPLVLARRRPPAQHHAGRPARRGRPHRTVPPLRSELHRDGPVRQRDADQRRDHVLGRGGGGRGRPPVSREHREHADLQLRAPRRPDEAGRWGQRSLRARGVRRRGDARSLGAGGPRRAVRHSGGGAARASHTGSRLRPRRVLGRRERDRRGR